MKRAAQIIPLLLAIVLASCSGGLPDMGLPGLRVSTPIPQGFYDNLANEYQNIADYEKNFAADPADAEYFLAKARRVLRRQTVAPDSPEERSVPDFALDELTEARAKLMDALTTMRAENNDALLAMAQSRYDCWLAHREDFPSPDAVIACRDDFFKALALLELPVKDDTVYAIYFDTASIALNADGKETVRKVAERFGDRDEWSVILKGYTDSKGDRQQNKVLSMRRAIAVKHALAQYGVPLDNIAISAEGEAADGDGDKSRRVEIQGRPAYTAGSKGLSEVPGWRHSEEF